MWLPPSQLRAGRAVRGTMAGAKAAFKVTYSGLKKGSEKISEWTKQGAHAVGEWRKGLSATQEDNVASGNKATGAKK